MTKLGVNIDHSATLRQARYRDCLDSETIVIEPNPLEIAALAELGGADSITAHLREDRRHMADLDLLGLRRTVRTKLNMEMSCAPSVVKTALSVKPDYACLVPENREEVTTEGGLDLIGNFAKVSETVAILSENGAVCSLFIDPEKSQIAAAKEIGAPVVELHTGAYANAWKTPQFEAEFERVKTAAAFAMEIGLTVNAGHGLNYLNVSKIVQLGFNELNIGHTIIARALVVGVRQAVAEMKGLLKE